MCRVAVVKQPNHHLFLNKQSFLTWTAASDKPQGHTAASNFFIFQTSSAVVVQYVCQVLKARGACVSTDGDIINTIWDRGSGCISFLFVSLKSPIVSDSCWTEVKEQIVSDRFKSLIKGQKLNHIIFSQQQFDKWRTFSSLGLTWEDYSFYKVLF